MFHSEMSEPDDETPNSKELLIAQLQPPPLPQQAAAEREPLITIDLDLDASWTFEQIFTAETLNMNSPFVLPGTDQSCSQLWTFADENEFKTDANDAVGSTRLSDCQRLTPYAEDPDSVIQGVPGQDDKTRLSHPFPELTPKDYLDGSFIIKERMTQALRYFKESTGECVLAQVWAPVKNGGRYVLTTSGQPFVLDPNSNGLHQYRTVSLTYMFPVDGETDGFLGLPGRVFCQRLPEWSPNVQYYSSKEFPRLNHAFNYNVRGTVALPVFEPSRQSCIGVLELIMTSEKVNYAPEVNKVCKALEAVNLRSSEILDRPSTQICNEGRQNALIEILEILTGVCETYELPLAQTWVPCRHHSVLADGGGLKKSCSSFDGSCVGQVCMSTTDVAFYVVDAHMWGFREACAEHHLQKGQGVAGRAFASQRSCFCEDITQFCKTEYPLVHYARMFGLASCFAICLRSTHTGNDDYILEFFLPLINPNAGDYSDQQALLNSVLLTLKNQLKSLRVASGNSLEHEWESVEIIKASEEMKHDSLSESVLMSKLLYSSQPAILPNRQFCSDALENKQLTPGKNTPNGGTVSELPEAENRASIAVNIETGKKDKKRGKAEITISLEVLQQYFSGSLKGAAKSLGVCPTTMKRICRQHGISRWPSRKINKVNRSLSKLKHVIESVQGADGAFTLSTIAPNSIPIAVGSTSWPPPAVKSNHHNSPPCRPSESPEEKNDFSNHRAPEIQGCALGNAELSYHQNCFAVGEVSNRSRTANGSREESLGSCSRNEPLPHHLARPPITIKATYREDIIRFRLALSSGIVKIQEEVAKRLKLEVGTFEIKYLDNDREWVLIACDADLLECIDISRSSGSNIIRLLIHDIMHSIGSSCESSGD